MWPFDDTRNEKTGPPAQITSLEQQLSAVKIAELEMRIAALETAIVELCKVLHYHLERIDHNAIILDTNMHNLATMVLKESKNLLGGGSEAN